MRTPIGDRVRRKRQARGWSLARLAGESGAATSYIWQLEHGKIAEPRPARLRSVARALGCTVADLTSESPERDERKGELLAALRESKVWTSLGLPKWSPEDVAGLSDRAVEALKALHELRREEERSEPAHREPSWLTQHQELRESIPGHTSREDLDDIAVALRKSAAPRGRSGESMHGPLSVTELKALARKQGLGVEISRRLPPQFISHLDEERARPTLYLSERLAPAHAVFNLARGIALFVLRRNRACSGTERNRFAEKTNVDYLSGALLIPKPALLQDVAALEYDIDALAKKWNSDWETVAIRCAQLPPDEGVPFHFVKMDPAGNLVGFMPGSGLPMEAAEGTCPKWGAIRVFLLAPLSVHRQYSRFTNGDRYFCFSRVVCYDRSDPLDQNPYARRDSQQFFYSITLGCRAVPENLKRIKYAKEHVHTEEVEVPIGPGCAGCQWEDCSQRVRPHITWTDFSLSMTTRKWSRFSRLTEEDQRDLHQALPAARPGSRKGGS